MKICLSISIRATVISLLVTSLLYSQNFNHIDVRLNSLKSKYYTSLNDLHKDLIYADYSKSEKVYAIAKYITDNISYGERARSPLNTIRSKQGVCQDYSELFIALCKLSNIKNYDHLDVENLMQLDVHFPDPYYFNKHSIKDSLFLYNFEEKFLSSPNRFSLVAYNIMMHFCNQNTLYSFEKYNQNSGKVNINAPLVRYSDYFLEKVER